MLRALLVAGSFLVGFPTARAQECAPPANDCVAASASFETATRSLPTDVIEAASFVAGYRVAACRARRACLIGDGDLQRVEAWADAELSAVRALADEPARTTWRAGLGARVPGMRTPAAALTAAPTLPSMAPATGPNPAILEQVVRLRDDLEQIRRFRPLVDEAERQSALRRDGSTPLACRGDVRERLQRVVREGLSSGAHHASQLRAKLDALCEPFEHWEHPPERFESRIRSFLAQLDRVEGFLNDRIRCQEPGPYDGRCRNTFGDVPADPAAARAALADARRALREVANARRAVRGVPERPFPCRDPLWERLTATTWSLRTAEAQIPSLGRAALQICEGLGVLPRAIERTHRDLSDTFERVRAQLTQAERSSEETLERLRAIYRLD